MVGSPRIFVITGPPAAGKTSLCRALLARFPLGFHIPVDDLREWVVSGIAHPIEWNDETDRQFQIAEEAACDVALRYFHAGFTVAIDHCRNLPRLDEVIASRLNDVPVVKVCLLPELEVNLSRNEERTDKWFDPTVLEEIIKGMSGLYRSAPAKGWLRIDNTRLTVEETVDKIIASLA